MSRIKATGGLSLGELRFCFAYLRCADSAHAAVQAGYKSEDGKKMIEKDAVVKYLQARVAEHVDASTISKPYVLLKLADTIEAAIDGRGHPAGIVDVRGIVQAAHEINLMMGYHAPVMQKNIDQSVDSIEEIKKIVAEQK